MFDRDDLFARHDPFGSFAASIAKTPAPESAFRVETAMDTCFGISKAEIRERLLECPVGMDLRPSVLQAIHEKAMLIDAFEAFRITAMHVSSRLARKSAALRKRGWVTREAQQAVNACVLQEQRRCAAKEALQDPLPDHHASLRRVFDIAPHLLRYATTRINDLCDEQRIPIVRVFLQGIPIHEVVLGSQRSMAELTQSMKVGLMTLQLEQIDGSE